MPLFRAGFNECRRDFFLGISRQNLINLARGNLHRLRVLTHINRWGLATSRTYKRQCVIEHTHGVPAYCALLDVGTRDPGEREEIAAHVCKHLNGVPVDGVQLIAVDDDAHHRIRINLR